MKALLDLPSSRFTPDSLARRSPSLRSLHDQPRLDNSPAAICVYSFGFAFLLCFFPSGSTLHQYILSQNGLTMSELRQGALATLTAQYSDSENESDGEGLSDRVVATPLNDASETSSPPTSAHKEGDRLRIPVIDNLARIESRSNSPSSNLLTSIESLAAASFTHHQKEVEIIDDEDRPSSPSSFHATLQGLTPDQITIPPAPPGHCSKSLLEKIDKLHNKMQNGADMNGAIQRRKDFRNPSIYEKLISYCGIDELGTNYPREIYAPSSWGPDSYYEELARRQKEEMDRWERERKDRTKVEFVTGTARKVASLASAETTVSEGRKRTKWDVSSTSSTATAVKGLASGVASTSGKPTVISAFGSIKRK